MSFWYWLVSWLPFEWAAPDTMLFMKNALLAVLVVTPLFGLLSTMVVESRMAFFSDALGHSAFTGMAIGALCGLAEPVGAAVVFAVVIALLFTLIRQKTHMASDTAISVFSSAAVALGIFLSTLGGQSFTKFNNLLIGDILSVAPGEIGLLALILLGVVILWVTSFNPMMLSSVHQALADSRGIRVVWKNFLFTAAIAVVVTITMTWVGLLVINALLVLPGAAARNVARNLPQYHLVSVVGGLVCGIGGLLVSYYLGPPPAPPSPCCWRCGSSSPSCFGKAGNIAASLPRQAGCFFLDIPRGSMYNIHRTSRYSFPGGDPYGPTLPCLHPAGVLCPSRLRLPPPRHPQGEGRRSPGTPGPPGRPCRRPGGGRLGP